MHTRSDDLSHGGLAPNGGFSPVADINVTPLVDVMLVLLIIFMVTAPMLAAGMKVNLPNARTAQSLDIKAPIIITVTREGTIAIDDQTMPMSEIGAAVRSRMGSDPDRIIHLRGDRETSYGTIVEIIDELSRHGLTRFAIRTNPQNAAAKTPASSP
jgi:biopolymer transport protein ExbD